MKLPLRFIHITKTAGTSIEEAARAHGIHWGRYNKELKEQLVDPQSYHEFWHFDPEAFHASCFDNQELFTVVRNPYERLVSEFFCHWGGAGLRDACIARSLSSVMELNRLMQKRIRWTHRHKTHWKSQSSYIFRESGERKIAHVLRFESVVSDFNALMKAYGIAVRLTQDCWYNQTAKVYSVKDLSESTRVAIQKAYRQDFELLGYCL